MTKVWVTKAPFKKDGPSNSASTLKRETLFYLLHLLMRKLFGCTHLDLLPETMQSTRTVKNRIMIMGALENHHRVKVGPVVVMESSRHLKIRVMQIIRLLSRQKVRQW